MEAAVPSSAETNLGKGPAIALENVFLFSAVDSHGIFSSFVAP